MPVRAPAVPGLFAALPGSERFPDPHQAKAATDAAFAATMATIARDEAEHAALSFAIAAWATPQLSPAERARIEAEKAAAIAQLRQETPIRQPSRLYTEAGLPEPETANRLLDVLEAEIWA